MRITIPLGNALEQKNANKIVLIFTKFCIKVVLFCDKGGEAFTQF